MPIIEAFATVVSLASDFSAGRDGKELVDLIEFQTWLIESGHQEIADAIEQSQATSIYIKALLNQQLPLIIESINEVSQKTSGIPISLEALLKTQSDVLLKAVISLERKITDVPKESYVINNHYGISLADHEAALKKRELHVIDELSKRETIDRYERVVLEKELKAITEKLSNLNQSYEEVLAARKAVENTLKEMRDTLPAAQVETAHESLLQGDIVAAKALFDGVIEQAEQNNKLAGKAAYENGRISEIEVRFGEALSYYVKAADFHPKNIFYINHAGRMLHVMGQYEKAIQYCQSALGCTPEEDLNLADTFNTLGLAHKALGQYEKAIKFYRLALSNDLKSVGEKDPIVAVRYNNLGNIYQFLHQLENANECFNFALHINLEVYGENHPIVATNRNNLGLVCLDLHQHDKAIENFELALQSDLITFGESHPSIATVRSNLGLVYGALGKHEIAIEHYEFSLRSDLNTFGENHPKIALRHNNLGSAYFALAQYETAIDYYQKALSQHLNIFGKNHPNVAEVQNNLAVAYLTINHHNRAIEYSQSALVVLIQFLGEDHPKTRECKYTLSVAKSHLENGVW